MKRKLAVLGSALVAMVTASFFVFVPSASAAVGLHVENGRIYEANGSEFIIRGVSHAHTWYPGETGSFENIKANGANLVRVVLSNGHQWTENTAADVANVISLCKANRLICMLEVHDTTGYGEQAAADTLDNAANYFVGLKDVLVGEESYIMINIGNEPFGNQGFQEWPQATSAAIGKLRDAGFEHAIVVDAPNWGQDWQFVMRDNAPAVAESDPLDNTIFSIHMYGVFDTEAEVTAYVDSFIERGLPLIVGEFGFDHSDGNPDEDTIMAHTTARGIGYIGWSWSGNGGGVEYLDMSQGFSTTLTSWGERIFNGPNGIKETAEEATVYAEAAPRSS